MAINYVRFQRGSQAAYDKLISTDRIDDNTLYFIYADKDANTGTLYMGDKLIGTSGIDISSLSLNDLTDVIVDGADTNSFLVKNEDGEWTSGDYDFKRLPETVYYNPKWYEIRAFTNHEESWNLNERPFDKQKPLEITKNKPEEKKKRNRNEEERERRGSQRSSNPSMNIGGGAMTPTRRQLFCNLYVAFNSSLHFQI